jgi:hypothetical protein
VLAVLRAYEDARKSARVLFLLDVSTAMDEPFHDVAGDRLRAAVEAVTATLRSVGDHDEIGAWEFAAGLGGAADHRVLVPMGRSSAEIAGRLRTEMARDRLRFLHGSGRSARLYDTLRAAVGTLRASGPPAAQTRDAVVIIADGSTREPGHAQLIDYLRAAPRPVPVFLVAFGTRVCASAEWREIIDTTGGQCYQAARAADLEEALNGVTAALWGEDLG